MGLMSISARCVRSSAAGRSALISHEGREAPDPVSGYARAPVRADHSRHTKKRGRAVLGARRAAPPALQGAWLKTSA